MSTPRFGAVKAIFFDLMGTCLDWHSGIVDALPHRIDPATRKQLAIAWREAFFDDIHAMFEHKLPPQDIDDTHRRLLDVLVGENGPFAETLMDESERSAAVVAWHHMRAWPEVAPAFAELRKTREVFVLANGTVRLQVDLARSSGLQFDLLLSSQLLGLTKPDPEIYRKAMSLVGVTPHESLMVAAHAYDLRAAKSVGMHTAYIRRWSEDTNEDMAQVQKDVDLFIGQLYGGDGNLDTLLNFLD